MCEHSEGVVSRTRSVVTVAKDVVYQDSHEWAKVDGETATVGISDFAQVCRELLENAASDVRHLVLTNTCRDLCQCCAG